MEDPRGSGVDNVELRTGRRALDLCFGVVGSGEVEGVGDELVSSGSITVERDCERVTIGMRGGCERFERPPTSPQASLYRTAS